jgi:PAS domain S-box-containing protein
MRLMSAAQWILGRGREQSMPFVHWMTESLSRTLLAGLALVLAASSLVFLIFFVSIYKGELEQERASASAQVNRLLQVSLENAMLKRDLPGLRDIVNRLGSQPEILDVMIVNPRREVRFASNQAVLGQRLNMPDLGCAECGDNMLSLPRMAQFIRIDNGKDVLRSVNPVMNKAPCTQCHGDLQSNPINGILVVDRDASGIRHKALLSAAMFSGAGVCVVLFVLTATWLILRNAVIAPISQLTRASRELAAGNLKVRTGGGDVRKDEIGVLYASFDSMVAQIERSLEHVRGKEAFLQTLIDTIPDGVRVIDEDYKIVMVNQAYCAQMQGQARELIGTPCFAAHGRTEPCIPTLTTCPFHASPTDRQTLKYMHNHQRADGSEFHVEITSARLTTIWRDEPHTLIIEVCRDVALQVKYSQEQRLAELGQLATGVAHEIYNPMASIRLGLQSLLKKIDRGEDMTEQLTGYLTTVDGEIDKCIEVTSRLLKLSMAPSGKMQLVSFTAIIPETLSLLQYEADRLGVEINVDLGDRELRVVARDSDLRMLVLNMVQNAFHAMPTGGSLIIRGQIRGDEVVIEIEDTGVGITTVDLPRIFDPFFSKRADGVEGTGLGLTICKAIVMRYKGRLDVYSAPGKGTLFRIAVPAANGESVL